VIVAVPAEAPAVTVVERPVPLRVDAEPTLLTDHVPVVVLDKTRVLPVHNEVAPPDAVIAAGVGLATAVAVLEQPVEVVPVTV